MERTLFERLGGIDAITAVVERFRDTVAEDDRINLKFLRTDMPRLRKMLIDQICEATGGPCSYYGKDMKATHTGMKITEPEWNATVENLVKALDTHKVAEREKKDLLGALGPMKADIVGQ